VKEEEFSEREEADKDENVFVYLATRRDPLAFRVDPDEAAPDEESADDEGQMRGVLYEPNSPMDDGNEVLTSDALEHASALPWTRQFRNCFQKLRSRWLPPLSAITAKSTLSIETS
jgi:hypothetical protein